MRDEASTAVDGGGLRRRVQWRRGGSKGRGLSDGGWRVKGSGSHKWAARYGPRTWRLTRICKRGKPWLGFWGQGIERLVQGPPMAVEYSAQSHFGS